jgi:hypothetical protein
LKLITGMINFCFRFWICTPAASPGYSRDHAFSIVLGGFPTAKVV